MAQVLRVLRLMRLVKLVKIVSSGIYSDKMEEWVGLQGKSKLRCVARHVAAQRDIRKYGYSVTPQGTCSSDRQARARANEQNNIPI